MLYEGLFTYCIYVPYLPFQLDTTLPITETDWFAYCFAFCFNFSSFQGELSSSARNSAAASQGSLVSDSRKGSDFCQEWPAASVLFVNETSNRLTRVLRLCLWMAAPCYLRLPYQTWEMGSVLSIRGSFPGLVTSCMYNYLCMLLSDSGKPVYTYMSLDAHTHFVTCTDSLQEQ